MRTKDTVSYRAKSSLLSATHWFNVLSALAVILGSNELRDLLGPNALKYALIALAAVNVLLRQFFTVRPVAFVAPKKTKAVPVEKL